MKLKAWKGNLDGRRWAFVISTSKAKARAVLGHCSAKDFDDHFTLQADFSMVGLGSLFKPDTLYTCKIDHTKGVTEWVEGRCPL